MNTSIEEKEANQRELAEQQKKLDEITSQYEKLKTLLDQKGYSRTRRENTRTTLEHITSRTSSLRFRRRKETKNVLEYIHGGEEGSLIGAWDYLAANAPKELMDDLIGKYKRGKYLEGIATEVMKGLSQSESSKLFHLSMQIFCPAGSITCFVKHSLLCLMQMMKYGSLVMLSVWVLTCKSNGNTNHFIFQFSDDGAPETSQVTMSVGSLTFWNLGERIRSREF